MSPEELDGAIEQLLEENPNQDKPARKRKNKTKDLVKIARKGKSVVSEKMVHELVGEDLYREITHVGIQYHDRDSILGTIEGWNENLKEIARYYGVDVHTLRLEKQTYYDWDKSKLRWTGLATVHIKERIIQIVYLDKYGRMVKSRGLYKRHFVVNATPIPEGIYPYDESIKSKLTEDFGYAPKNRVLDKLKVREYQYNSEKVFQYDTKGKYESHRKAMAEWDKMHYLSGTIPIQKGDIRGTKTKYINAVNANLRDGVDFMDGANDLAQDLEDAYRNIIYEYIW